MHKLCFLSVTAGLAVQHLVVLDLTQLPMELSLFLGPPAMDTSSQRNTLNTRQIQNLEALEALEAKRLNILKLREAADG
ncbi:hypothetical protein INR49_015885 [Caranx melampygus]|nr:hypothetical protein INR49_015885 [Caranx melampygus]